MPATTTRPMEESGLVMDRQRSPGGRWSYLSDEPRPLAGRYVLIIEDDRATANFVRFVLAEVGGAQVQVYCDPAIALQTVEPGNWDAVVTDIVLPSMTGSEFTRRAHRIDRYLPVITMTAFPSLANRIKSAKADSVRFLTKPVPVELLLSSVLEVVDPFGNWIREAG
ncbi:MAG: hypothetical protein DRJ28_02465 [Actinobacteria bacterium]|nr:MAG: hypothetical protein DRJ28_02465 [Actinomycetota bacterium]